MPLVMVLICTEIFPMETERRLFFGGSEKKLILNWLTKGRFLSANKIWAGTEESKFGAEQ